MFNQILCKVVMHGLPTFYPRGPTFRPTIFILQTGGPIYLGYVSLSLKVECLTTVILTSPIYKVARYFPTYFKASSHALHMEKTWHTASFKTRSDKTKVLPMSQLAPASVVVVKQTKNVLARVWFKKRILQLRVVKKKLRLCTTFKLYHRQLYAGYYSLCINHPQKCSV